MLNIDSIQKEIKQLEMLQVKLVSAVRNAPKGTLYYRKSANGTNVPYYTLGAGKARKRVRLNPASPEQRELLRKLKDKNYAKHLLPRVRKNLQALRAAAAYQPISRSFLNEPGDPYEDCYPRFFGLQAQRDEFDLLEERQNPYHPEQMNIQDKLGAFRSKNELLGAQVLDDLQLRYKYEAPLYTPYGVKYPDFTVLHPITGRVCYIEIAGRMDDPEYRQDLYNKLEAYAEAGIYPGINLLVISEEPGKGLDVTRIRDQIAGFFGL